MTFAPAADSVPGWTGCFVKLIQTSAEIFLKTPCIDCPHCDLQAVYALLSQRSSAGLLAPQLACQSASPAPTASAPLPAPASPPRVVSAPPAPLAPPPDSVPQPAQEDGVRLRRVHTVAVRDYLKRETQTFFGVQRDNEREQRRLWYERRRRHAARALGDLRLDLPPDYHPDDDDISERQLATCIDRLPTTLTMSCHLIRGPPRFVFRFAVATRGLFTPNGYLFFERCGPPIDTSTCVFFEPCRLSVYCGGLIKAVAAVVRRMRPTTVMQHAVNDSVMYGASGAAPREARGRVRERPDVLPAPAALDEPAPPALPRPGKDSVARLTLSGLSYVVTSEKARQACSLFISRPKYSANLVVRAMNRDDAHHAVASPLSSLRPRELKFVWWRPRRLAAGADAYKSRENAYKFQCSSRLVSSRLADGKSPLSSVSTKTRLAQHISGEANGALLVKTYSSQHILAHYWWKRCLTLCQMVAGVSVDDAVTRRSRQSASAQWSRSFRSSAPVHEEADVDEVFFAAPVGVVHHDEDVVDGPKR
ncbi:hypothetical protein MSG28_004064 [Choristoneura fumiferana]|uniref:Uncharacterized protein n=1 Tax=Choristoneura fumiferana TaxID=7141 RepID=A0ACC0KHU5_CHOFU|nr:hypothetical protein MSG28_004064 [Choristoneura fumiferana]